MPRIKFALARGEASSVGRKRKMGHIRTCGDCERHSPQRLHGAVASATRCGSQLTCSSTRSRSGRLFRLLGRQVAFKLRLAAAAAADCASSGPDRR